MKYLDLAHEPCCQTLVDKEPGRYLGHVTTALLMIAPPFSLCTLWAMDAVNWC